MLEAVGCFAAWTASQSPLDAGDSIADRCTPAAAAGYVEDTLRRVRQTTMRMRLDGLRRGLAVMWPTRDWCFLARMLGNLSSTPDLQGKRLRIRSTSQLLDFGLELMGKAEMQVEPHGRLIDHAVRHRNGLIIALLSQRPLRRRNLTGLILGRHLLRTGNGWWLAIPGPETKTGQPIEFGWPRVLVEPLERYLDHWRPMLAAMATNPADAREGFLWLSRCGTRLHPHTLSVEVSELTRAAFGGTVNVHLFRDCLATDIAINDPEHVAIAAALLGHRQLATTERHYNLARSVEAAADYHRALKRLR